MAGLYVVERLKGQVQAGLAAEYQRYAVDRARRQAISRAAAACAASATRVAGSPPAGPTDKVAAVAAPRVPLSDAEVLGQLDRGRLWRSSQAFARDVLAEIRQAHGKAYRGQGAGQGRDPGLLLLFPAILPTKNRLLLLCCLHVCVVFAHGPGASCEMQSWCSWPPSSLTGSAATCC